MRHIYLPWCALLTALAFASPTHAQLTSSDATDVTQTRATLHAEFPSDATAKGFEYKYGTLTSLTEFDRLALSPFSDPVNITTTGKQWSARQARGWVESCKDLTSGQYSEMTTTFTLTSPTTVTFEWSVDSEENYGILSFQVDNSVIRSISGSVPFSTVSYTLNTGKHTLKWRYDKKSSTNVGLDLGMVRNINIANTTPGEWIAAEASANHHTISNLYPAQSYIWRAYSKNDATGTNYSPLKQFTTGDVSVDSVQVSDITQTKARFTTQVNPGDAQVIKGYEWQYGGNNTPAALAFLSPDCGMPISIQHYSAWGIGSEQKSLTTSIRADGNKVTITFEMPVAGYVRYDYTVYGGEIRVYYDNASYISLKSSSASVERYFSKGKHTIIWSTYYSASYHTYRASLSNLSFTDSQKNIIYRNDGLDETITINGDDNTMSVLKEGLKPGHSYFIRSFIKPDYDSPLASTWDGTYSPWQRFSTLNLHADTVSAVNIKQASATIRGIVKGGDATIIARGLQYRDKEGKRFTDFPSATADTLLSVGLTRLRPSTDYEYRAYIQAEGCDTVFSPLATFRTADVVPVKPEVLAVTQHSAKIQGKVISGDATIYQRGMQFCKYGTGWEDIEDGGIDSIFVLSKTDLLLNQKYKARTFVQPAGSAIIYSDVLEFTTNGLCDTVTDIFQRSAIVKGHIESDLSDIAKSYYTIDAVFERGHTIDEPSNLTGSFDILMGSQKKTQTIFFDYKISGEQWSTDGHYLYTPDEDGEHELLVELNLPHDCLVTFEYNGWGENGASLPLSWIIDDDTTISYTEMDHLKKILQKGNHKLLLRVETEFKQSVPVRLQVGEIPVDFPIASDGSFIFKATNLTPCTTNGITITTADKEGKISNSIVKFYTKDYFKYPFSVTDVSQSGAVLSAELEKTDDKYEEIGFAYDDTSQSTTWVPSDEWSKTKGEITDSVVVAALKNLQPSHSYHFVPYTKVEGKYYYCKIETMYLTANGVDISVKFSDVSQTRASMTASVNKGDAKVTNFRYSLDGGEYQPYINNVNFTGLRPATKHTVDFAAEVNGETKYWRYDPNTDKRYSFTTLSTSVNLVLDEVAQTLIGASWATNYGDATYVTSGLEYGTSQSALTEHATSESKSVRINELTPSTTYYFRAYLETKEGGRVYSPVRSAKTKAITCSTGKATDVSNNSAKFHGTINCDNYSPSYRFGFQWKQMQGWAADPAFTRANKLDDGTITLGLVDRMLKPDTDYQFRTAVMRGDEVVACGADWQTFRTELEYIYYPGTVYTLYRTDRETNSLILCGYYVAGSEAVTSQGYEYWIASGNKAEASSPTAQSGVVRITTDETMRHTLDINTLEDGNYRLRAFATTANATIYGETLGFTIDNGSFAASYDINSDSGITCYGSDEGIIIDNANGYSAVIMDVTGRQLSHKENMDFKECFPMAQGAIYIVKVSDGSVFKVKL